MASNFDLPANGSQILPANVRTDDGKSSQYVLSKTKMAVGNVAKSSEASYSNVRSSNASVLSPSNNITLDLSILLSMCGPGNLSYPIAPNPAGSILPFGLFPFGLAVPRGSGVRNILDHTPLSTIVPGLSCTREKASNASAVPSFHSLPNANKMAVSHVNTQTKKSNSKDVSEGVQKSMAPTGIRGMIVNDMRYPQSTGHPVGGVKKVVHSNTQGNIQRINTELKNATVANAEKLCFRDAEAAAILLGMANSGPTSSTQTCQSQNKRINHATRYPVPTKRKCVIPPTVLTGEKLMKTESIVLPKSNNISVSEPGMGFQASPNLYATTYLSSHSVFRTQSNEMTAKPSSTYRCRGNSTKPEYERKQQQPVSSKNILDESSSENGRHFICPVRVKSDARTSVVSHLPSCICAFDNPSQLKHGATNHRVDPNEAHSHHLNNGGFNFKKLICKKFNHLPNPPAGGEDFNRVMEHNVSIPSHIVTDTTTERNLPSEITPIKGVSCEGSHSCYRVTSSNASISHKQTEYDQTRAVLQLHFDAMKRSSGKLPCANQTHRIQVSNDTRPTSNKGQAGVCEYSIVPASSHINTMLATKPFPRPTQIKDGEVRQKPSCLQTIHMPNSTPSFSELRQQSVEIVSSSTATKQQSYFSEQRKKSTHSKLPISNLYRIRKSGVGGSNESLHSVKSGHADSGDESDSSGSSSDSDCSRDDDLYSNSPEMGLTIRRSPFVLSKPKFTLDRSQSPQIEEATSTSNSMAEIPKLHGHSSKVNLRRPVFNFKSGSSNLHDKSGTPENKNHTINILELKTSDDEGDQSFKSKFIRALGNPDLKEGLAVDGKSLRALVGEANYFYHNNKKYVLKRGLTKCKPRDGFIADVAETNGNLVSIKNIKNVNNREANERSVQRNIEPRVSVTATKKNEPKLEPNKKHRKKSRKSKRPVNILSRTTRFEQPEGRMVDGMFSEIEELHNKRHRRTHEIDKLIFEGAGGSTPLPDLALRDSDVFSNIKLRRREAAKRGIGEVKDGKNESCSRGPKSAKLIDRREQIKRAANERAVSNKNRRISIKKKIHKNKLKRPFFNKRLVETMRNPCVRINAGVSKSQLDDKTHEFFKVTENSFTDRIEAHRSEDIICTVVPESKQSLADQAPDRNGRHDTITDDERVDKDNSLKNIQCNVRIKATISNAKRKSFTSSNDVPGGSNSVATYWNSDDVRSNSPPIPKLSLRKRRQCSVKPTISMDMKVSRRKYNKSYSLFNLVSCFPTSSALTLDSVFGDLKPSFSVNRKSSAGQAWKVGKCAKDSKQHLQRELWRNMTIDMFCNGNNSCINTS